MARHDDDNVFDVTVGSCDVIGCTSIIMKEQMIISEDIVLYRNDGLMILQH